MTVAPGLAEELLQMFAPLKQARRPWEIEWQEAADLALPSASRGVRLAGSGMPRTRSGGQGDEPSSRDGARRRLETLPVRLVNMLSSMLEMLATPDNDKWHGYQLDNLFGGEARAEELSWCDRLRDYTFGARYDPRAGFALANKRSIKSACALGTGIFMVEDYVAGGAALPWRYRFCPLSQNYLACDAQGQVDTDFQLLSMEARQIAMHPVWGPRMSPAVKEAANAPGRGGEKFNVLFAVYPRMETGTRGNARRNAKFACVAIEESSKAILEESGYDEFPFCIDHWETSEEGPYGEGAVAFAIDDIRGLMHTRRMAARGLGNAVNPATATTHDGVLMKPNLNPGRNNPGGLNPDGTPRIRSLLEMPNLSHIQAVLEGDRRQVREALYADLIQVLSSRPDMTAAEVWARAGEKGDIFGPIGKNLQTSRARMNDREIAILERRGAFAQGSFLVPPKTLAGRRFRVKSSSPLDRLRRSGEAMGAERLLQLGAQVEPLRAVLGRRFNIDKAYQVAREAYGAPADMLLSPDEIAEADEAEAGQQQQMQMMAAAPPMAKAAKDAAGAMQAGAATPGLAEQLQALLGQRSEAAA